MFSRISNLPDMRVASTPALLAIAEASCIESTSPQKLKGGTKKLLTRCNHDGLSDSDTPQDDRVSRFILTSVPVLNPSMSKSVGFPVKQRNFSTLLVNMS